MKTNGNHGVSSVSGSVEAADPRVEKEKLHAVNDAEVEETGGALALRRMHAGHHELLPDQV